MTLIDLLATRHAEEVLPPGSMEGQIIGIFTALAAYCLLSLTPGRENSELTCYYSKHVRFCPDESRSSSRTSPPPHPRRRAHQDRAAPCPVARASPGRAGRRGYRTPRARRRAGRSARRGRRDFEGTSEGELDEPLARQAAQLCRLAGADETLIPHWIAEGRRRAGAARTRPHSGQFRSSPLPHRSNGAACPPAGTGAGGAAIQGQGPESSRWESPAWWR